MRNYKSGMSMLLLLFPVCSFAVELGWANLRMSGNIIAESCDVGTSSADVHLGDFPQHSFSNVGDVSPAKGFDIKLLGCSSGIRGGYVTFSGTADTTNANAGLLALSDSGASENIAQGVAIQILDNADVSIPLNETSAMQPLIPGDNVLHFKLRYKATAIPVKPGEANSVMYFDITYP